MKNILLIAGILSFCLFANAQQVARSITATNGKKIGFYEYKPGDYSKSKKYPLIIFLHGIGERGNGTTDLYKVKNNAIPRLINAGNTMTFTNPNTGVQETFLVLSPQLDKQYGSWDNFYVDAMLKYAKSNLSIDPNRVFLCGLSLGGGGVWKYATNSLKNANEFAGIIPCCGTGEGTNFCNLNQAKTAVWAFHAMDDGTVGVGNTQYAQTKISQCSPALSAKFTYYPNGGHAIWERAFDPGHGIQNPNVYEWMLGLSRNGKNDNNDNQGQDGNSQKPQVPNVAPVANAGGDKAITLPVNTVTLNGTASKDSDGSIKKYAWTKVSGPNGGTIVSPSASTTNVTGLTVGTYVFQLTVTDDGGATASDKVTVSVNAAVVVNQAPTANAGTAQAITLPVNTVTLNGTASKDGDGSIKKYAWSKVSGPSSGTIGSPSAATTKVTGLTAGSYVYQLTVTDDDGATASNTVAVTVNAAVVVNQPPLANAGAAQVITLPVNSVTLNGSGSKDYDGKIVSYAWTKISGPGSCSIASPSAVSTKLTGLVAGAYVFNLSVTDNSGATSSATVAVTVNPVVVANKPPIANADKDFTTANNYAYLSGAGSYDLDGRIVSWVWQQISGPSNVTWIDKNTMFPTVQNLVPGAYTFKLTVTDNSGATASDEVEVKVTKSSAKPPVANAGNDFSTTNNYAYLSGAGSYDLDGQITSWSWWQVSGPNTATILAGNDRFPTVQNLVKGVYTFRMKITDSHGLSATDDVVLTVKANTAKTAVTGEMSTQALGSDVNVATNKLNELAKEPSIFPNPATTQITVTFNNDYVGNYKFVVYDVKGKIVTQYNYSKQAGQVQQQLDISKLPGGMYYLETIYEGSLKPVIRKFVKL